VIRQLALCFASCILPGTCLAQSPTEVSEFHDRVVELIQEVSSRPLTPGDTFLTWNPKPGGLIHTIRVTDTTAAATLLRGDGMIGTAAVRLVRNRPASFDVVWTTRDSATGKALPDRESHGVVVGDSMRISGTKPQVTSIPPGRWAIADFGMEELLIPLLRDLPIGGPHRVAVFRPWHGRWDSISVQVRDTAGVRFVDERQGIALGDAKQTHEVVILNAQGDLLAIVRFDQADERRPLEGSARWAEYRKTVPSLVPIIRQFATPPNP